jgi:chromosome segregation ATPase
MIFHRKNCLAAAAILMCLLPGIVVAQSTSDKQIARLQEQVRRLRQQVQTSQQSADSSAQEKNELDGRLRKSDEELTQTRRKGQDIAHRLAESELRIQKQETENSELAAKFSEAEKQIETLRKQKSSIEDQLAARDVSISVLDVKLKAETEERQHCVANNQALYNYGTQLLSAYRDKGVFSAMSQRDPVLNLGSVKIENVLEEYRDKLDEKRLPMPDAKVSVGPSGP